jgi:hypothetical protein
VSVRERHNVAPTAIAITTMIILAMSLLASFSGCDSDNISPCDPEVRYGRISGAIANESSEATIRIVTDRIYTSENDYARYVVPVGDDGIFDIALPAGNYLVRSSIRSYTGYYHCIFYLSDDGTSSAFNARDTIEVTENSNTRFNVEFGGLELYLTPPAEYTFSACTFGPVNLNGAGSFTGMCYSVSTNGRVHALLSDLPPGSYLIRIDAESEMIPHYAERPFYLPQTRDPAQAQVFTITPDQLESFNMSLAKPTLLSGQIIYSWQDANSSNPYLRFISNRDSSVITSVSANDDGYFSTHLFAPEPCKALVYYDRKENWIGGSSFDDCELFEPQPGQDVLNINHYISGFLLDFHNVPDGNSGRPLAQLFRADDLNTVVFEDDFILTTTAQLSILNLDPGEYFLKIGRGGYSANSPWFTQWYPGVVNIEDADPIIIRQPGDIEEITVQLLAGGVIEYSGSSNTAEQLYSYDAAVTAATDELPFLFGSTSYDSETNQVNSTVRGLANGDYKVAIRSVNRVMPRRTRYGEWFWYPGTTNWDEAGAITINDYQTISGLEFTSPIPLPPEE